MPVAGGLGVSVRRAVRGDDWRCAAADWLTIFANSSLSNCAASNRLGRGEEIWHGFGCSISVICFPVFSELLHKSVDISRQKFSLKLQSVKATGFLFLNKKTRSLRLCSWANPALKVFIVKSSVSKVNLALIFS